MHPRNLEVAEGVVVRQVLGVGRQGREYKTQDERPLHR